MSILSLLRKPHVKDGYLQIYGPTVLPLAYSLEEFLSCQILSVLYIDMLTDF